MDNTPSSRTGRQPDLSVVPAQNERDQSVNLFSKLLGNRFPRLKSEWQRLATEPRPILITGESGTGKSTCAELIHSMSPRKQQPLQRWGCGEIDADFANASLFGYKKGAFTGAEADNPGLLATTHEGSLILDDIDYLPVNVQSKLLRFMDTGHFNRLGEPGKTYQADVRLIVTTNKDLFKLVDEQRFLPDLLYRIRSWWIDMPSLRDRPNGTRKLTQFLLHQRATQRGIHLELDDSALELLKLMPLNGNMRELSDLIEILCVYSNPDISTIDAADFCKIIGNRVYGNVPLCNYNSKEKRENQILEVLRLTQGQVPSTAQFIGCAPNTVYTLAKKHGIPTRKEP